MKTSSRLAVVVLAFASCAVGAQTVYSGQADQERRERNREEALAHYRTDTSSSSMNTNDRKEGMRDKTHEVAQKTRHETHQVADATRRVTHKSANAVRHAGHQTAVKARDITARTDAKFGTSPKGNANPEGINPVGTSSASPTAPSNGVTK
jgi:hypothetical protein